MTHAEALQKLLSKDTVIIEEPEETQNGMPVLNYRAKEVISGLVIARYRSRHGYMAASHIAGLPDEFDPDDKIGELYRNAIDYKAKAHEDNAALLVHEILRA